MAEQKKPANGRRKHPKDHPAETPEPTEPANPEPAEAEGHSEPEAHPEPAEQEAVKADPTPGRIEVSLASGGRGLIDLDGTIAKVPVPGSWIAFPGHSGFPIDFVLVPAEAVEDLCRATGYQVPE